MKSKLTKVGAATVMSLILGVSGVTNANAGNIKYIDGVTVNLSGVNLSTYDDVVSYVASAHDGSSAEVQFVSNILSGRIRL
ncbi:MAG: hypothetical protein LBI63_05325 [Candidatus Ancillula sp.]|jgi:hypothetical protein|nr:hypothetical protein [Candidatus Ancillula sp.]